MTIVAVDVYGLEDIETALRSMGPGLTNRLLGPALGEMAKVVRAKAKQPNFVFTDRFGHRSSSLDGLQVSKYGSLRQSIRVRRIRGKYGGKSYKSGRAAVFAGGPGARQAHLVEEGHAGPWEARPYPYLVNAMILTREAQSAAFLAKARAIFPKLVALQVNKGKVSGVARASARARNLSLRRVRRR